MTSQDSTSKIAIIMPRVFLVTGTSTGFGKELIEKILSSGDHAIATARNSSKLSFKGATSDNLLAVDLDVTSKSSIDATFAKGLEKFKRIDVVVNNAGYGLSGPFETLSDNQIRTQMEVNFFGLIDVTRKALEVMRDVNKPSGGLIQQITSIGGQRGVPTFSIYCASKWAVEGFTEALSHEIKPEWGIHVQCVEPGGFRTDWSGRSMAFGERKTAAYDHIDAEKNAKDRNGTQAGDPAKGANAMYELATMQDPPLRCVIGTDAYKAINGKLETYKENVAKFEKLSNSTDV